MADLNFLTDSQKLRHSLLDILANSNHYYTVDEYVEQVKTLEAGLFSDGPAPKDEVYLRRTCIEKL